MWRFLDAIDSEIGTLLHCRANQGFQDFQVPKDQKVNLAFQAPKEERGNHLEVEKESKVKRFVDARLTGGQAYTLPHS